MKKNVLLFLMSFWASSIQAQKISQLITQDTMVYVFKLNYEQSKMVLKQGQVFDTDVLFTKKYKEYPRSRYKVDTLPSGNYISATITDHLIQYNYSVITPFVFSAKVLKDEVIIYLSDKKTKELLKNAKMEVDGKPIAYDPGCGGYSILKKDINQKKVDAGDVFMKVSYDAEVYAFKFLLTNNAKVAPQQDYYDNRNVELNSPGYLILDKPMYKPLDTMNLKAFLVNFKNGRMLRKRTRLSITEDIENFSFTKTLRRKTPGAYLYQWKIPDSLKLDRYYTVSLRYNKLGRHLVKRTSFKLENYELAKNVYAVDMPESTFFAGDDIVFYATAKDMNGFPIQGTQVHYQLRLITLYNLHQDSLSISLAKRNNWYAMDTTMDYESFTEYRIPSSVLPNANAQYALDVTFVDPVTFEKKAFTQMFTKYGQTEKVLFYQKEDSLHIRTLYNGKDTAGNFLLVTLRGGDTITKRKIITPYHYHLSPMETSAVLVDKELKKLQINIQYNKLDMMHVKGKRSGDSIRISFAYPFSEPIHYRIYKKDKLIQSGESNQLSFTALDRSLDKYRMVITHNLQLGIESNFYEFTFVPEKNKLHMETTIPKQALPGDSLAVEVTVKDFKDRVRKRINVAAYAMNKAFAEQLASPYIDVPYQYQNRVEIKPMENEGIAQVSYQSFTNTYSLDNKHFKRFNLRKNEYYQLKYPEQELTILKIKKQQAMPEFGLFITHKNALYSPKYILVDGQPVYLSDVNWQDIYSFAVSEGQHQISFRYFNKLYELPQQNFSSNTKYLFGLNIDSIKGKQSIMSITDSLSPIELTTQEKDLLYSTLLLTNTFPSDSLEIVSTNLNYQKKYYNSYRMPMMTIDGNTYYVQGPFKRNEMITLKRNNKSYSLQTGIETVYHYDEVLKDFTPRNLGKLKGAFFHFGEINLQLGSLLAYIKPDTAVPEPQKANLDFKPKVQEALRNKEADEENLYQNYKCPTVGNYFSIWVENNTDSQFIKSMWVVSKTSFETADFVQNFPHQIYTFNKYKPEENYDIYFFLNKNRMVILKNQTYDAFDNLYVNPKYLKTEPFNKEKLEVPLKIYSELHAVPLLPFYDSPLEASEKIKKQEGSRNNVYFHGMITNETQMPLSGALVYMEMNGVFKYGAKTNANGLFEILDMIPGSYQVKLYHPEYKISHFKPILFEGKSEYDLNATMAVREISSPLFETIQNDFRFMAFARHPMDNMFRVMIHDKETRSVLENYQVKLFKKGELLRTYNSNGLYVDIPFPMDDKTAYALEITKANYTTLKLNQIYFRAHYHFMLDGFLGLEKKEILKVKEFNLNMQGIPDVEKLIATNSDQVQIYDRGTGQQGECYGTVLDENGQPMKGAVIQMIRPGKPKLIVATDEAGHFSLKPIAQGEYLLQISYVSYPMVEMKKFVMQANQRLELMVTMRKGLGNNALKTVDVRLDKSSLVRDKSITMSTGAATNAMYEANLSVAGSPTVSYSYSAAAPMNNISMKDDSRMLESVEVSAGNWSVDSEDEAPSREGEADSFKPSAKAPNYADASMIDQVIQNKNTSTTRKNFNDVGFWKPNMVTNKQGKVAFTIKLPDNITTWKSYLMAMGKRWMHGIDSSEIKVYKPLQTIVTVPNYMYKGDRLLSKIKYQNLTKDPLDIVARASINGKELIHRSLTIQHSNLDSMEVTAFNQDSIIYEAGLTYQERYKDAERYTIPVFSPALIFHTNQSIFMDQDSSYILNMEPNTKGVMIFNNTLMEKIMAIVDEVNGYEYGCVEQTTSKLNALLMKDQILNVMKQPMTGKKDINILLAKLTDMQNLDGSFGWWKQNGSNDRMTIYAMEITYKALKWGYSNNIYNSSTNYVVSQFLNMSTSDKVYAYHVMLNTGSTTAAINQAYTDIKEDQLNTTDKLYFYQNKRMLAQPVNEADVYAVFLELNRNAYRPYSDNFFYDYKADIFKAYSLFKGSTYEKQFVDLFKTRLLHGELESNLNTFSKVAMIEALTSSSLGDTTKPIQSTLTINDSLVIKKYPARIKITGTRYTIKHAGGDVFLNTAEEHQSETPAISDSVFGIRTNFKQGGTASATIQSGKECEMAIDIQAYKKGEHVMVEVPIPSGMKVRGKSTTYNKGEYIQYFKHKVVYYFELLPMGTRSLRISLMPVFKGNFIVAPAKVSLMYYPYVYGNTGKSELNIK